MEGLREQTAQRAGTWPWPALPCPLMASAQNRTPGSGTQGPALGPEWVRHRGQIPLLAVESFLQRAARPGALGAGAGLRSALGLARRPGPHTHRHPGVKFITCPVLCFETGPPCCIPSFIVPYKQTFFLIQENQTRTSHLPRGCPRQLASAIPSAGMSLF